MTDLPILHTIPSGHSGTGVSYYSAANTCARKARLDEEAREMYANMDPFGQDDDAEGYVKTNAALVGTVFHALAELYYTVGGSPKLALELNQLDNASLKEGYRVFAEYAKHHPTTEWKTLDAEIGLNTELHPQIVEALGVEPFTCRIDLVVEITEDHVASFKKRREVDIAPGRYLLDHKTRARDSEHMQLEHENSLQFAAYQMAYNAVHHEAPCSGMIVNTIIKHKEMKPGRSFKTHLVAYPDSHMQTVVRNFLKRGAEAAKTDECNPAACLGGWSPCAHLLNGACTRV